MKIKTTSRHVLESASKLAVIELPKQNVLISANRAGNTTLLAHFRELAKR